LATVSLVNGVTIKVYIKDHPPPHVHAIHAGRSAKINLDPIEVVASSLAPAEERNTVDWVRSHQTAFLAAWAVAEQGRIPAPIDR